MKIRTHQYAEIAYPLVSVLIGNSLESKYRTLVLNFPTMVMQAGLAQSIGFLMAKGKNKDKYKNEYLTLLQHLADLLNEKDYKDLHDAVIASTVSDYMLMTRKVLDASSWLKRYTQALLSKEEK